MFRRLIASFLCLTFSLSNLQYSYAQDFSIDQLPVPGTMVSVSPSFNPALIKGLTVHKDNPFLFDFIVDPGQSKLSQEDLKEESDRMIKYFFAALTIPDKDIWVNLSPYEKDRMIPESLGVTAMGRDLLAQDYMLKQLTASLIYPQQALGKTFWTKVYAKAKEEYGTTQIPVNTFNKVWIVPQRVGVYEHGQTAYIVDGHLKVMLEEDYLSLTKHNAISNTSIASETNQSQVNKIGSQIIRQIVLPEIEKEVNEDKNFACLRQIFYAQALAVWFKQNLKQALLNRVYANKDTVKGIDQNNPATNEAIFQQYLKAYKKGVFNYIKEDIDPVTQETLPRKYFSGGYNMAMLASAEQRVELSPNAARDVAVEAGRDVDETVVVDTNGDDAKALAQNVDAEWGLQQISIATELGLNSQEAADLNVVIKDMNWLESDQAMTSPEMQQVLHQVAHYGPRVIYAAGVYLLGQALRLSYINFKNAKSTTDLDEKIKIYEKMDENWRFIAGPIAMFMGALLFAHQPGVDQVWVNGHLTLLGTMITGGAVGYGAWVKKTLAAAKAARDAKNNPELFQEKMQELDALENFKGNLLRRIFNTAQYFIYLPFVFLVFNQQAPAWLHLPKLDAEHTTLVRQWAYSVGSFLFGLPGGVALAKLEQAYGKGKKVTKTVNAVGMTLFIATALFIHPGWMFWPLIWPPAEKKLLKEDIREGKIAKDEHIEYFQVMTGEWKDGANSPWRTIEGIAKLTGYPDPVKLADINNIPTPQTVIPNGQNIIIPGRYYISGDVGNQGDYTPRDIARLYWGTDAYSSNFTAYASSGLLGEEIVSLNADTPLGKNGGWSVWVGEQEQTNWWQKEFSELPKLNTNTQGTNWVPAPQTNAPASNTVVFQTNYNGEHYEYIKGLGWYVGPPNANVFFTPKNIPDAVLKEYDNLKTSVSTNNPDKAMAMTVSNDLIVLNSDLKLNHINQINRELERLRALPASRTEQSKKGKGFMETILVNDRLTEADVDRINLLRARSNNGRIIIKVVKNALDIYDAAMAGNFGLTFLKTKLSRRIGAKPVVLSKELHQAAQELSEKMLSRGNQQSGDSLGLMLPHTRLPMLPTHNGDVKDKAMNGGIDLSEQGSALHVQKDANGGVVVDVDPALIARVEREGMSEVDPVIVNMRPADLQSLFGVKVIPNTP